MGYSMGLQYSYSKTLNGTLFFFGCTMFSTDTLVIPFGNLCPIGLQSIHPNWIHLGQQVCFIALKDYWA